MSPTLPGRPGKSAKPPGSPMETIHVTGYSSNTNRRAVRLSWNLLLGRRVGYSDCEPCLGEELVDDATLLTSCSGPVIEPSYRAIRALDVIFLNTLPAPV